MDESLQVVVIALCGAAGIGVIAWLVNHFHKMRVAELEAFAAQMGFRFVHGTVDGGGGLGCLSGLFGVHEPEQFPLMDRYEAFQPFGALHRLVFIVVHVCAAPSTLRSVCSALSLRVG